MASPFTVPCKGVKLGFYTVPTGNPNPGPLRCSPLHHCCATPALLYYADKMLKANDFTLKHLQVV